MVRVSDRCTAIHGFDSRLGLGFFFLSTLVSTENYIFLILLLAKQVDDVQLNLEKERAAVSALEKKQRKFDQVSLYNTLRYVE